ncbi:hypothetical protein K435DRAFT_805637 [Dendrothele bispora CBS 962.96]|uniref:Uncharacterized protein n=1 Tax=Dendrothele bispora (strain CBS 962.96) TaxID=1314807 RepID=A0A4S8LAW6_DENBC|nr:hypothetical protein K435DRAFT_805637 [Dendrothele bispora CBS 962.96]
MKEKWAIAALGRLFLFSYPRAERWMPDFGKCPDVHHKENLDVTTSLRFGGLRTVPVLRNDARSAFMKHPKLKSELVMVSTETLKPLNAVVLLEWDREGSVVKKLPIPD